jgi:hypothetical protein
MVWHPHSGVKETIIPLEHLDSAINEIPDTVLLPQIRSKPWAPFRSREDFEYTETAVTGLLSKDIVNKQLFGMRNRWAKSTRITLRSHSDMEKSLTAARQYGVKVCRIPFNSMPR